MTCSAIFLNSRVWQAPQARILDRTTAESVRADHVSLMLNSGLLRMVRPTKLPLPAGGALASNTRPAGFRCGFAVLSPSTYLHCWA